MSQILESGEKFHLLQPPYCWHEYTLPRWCIKGALMKIGVGDVISASFAWSRLIASPGIIDSLIVPIVKLIAWKNMTFIFFGLLTLSALYWTCFQLAAHCVFSCDTSHECAHRTYLYCNQRFVISTLSLVLFPVGPIFFGVNSVALLLILKEFSSLWPGYWLSGALLSSGILLLLTTCGAFANAILLIIDTLFWCFSRW